MAALSDKPWRLFWRDRRGSTVSEYASASAMLVLGCVAGLQGMKVFMEGAVSSRVAEAVLTDGYEYPLDGLDFTARSINPSGNGQDHGGAYRLLDSGRTIELLGNAWKATAFDYVIGPDTLLSFNFRTDVAGEIHAIGFQKSTEDFSATTFKIHGPEAYGIETYAGTYTVGEGLKHYEIPVGKHFSGSVNKIIFVMDDDALVGANSLFSNVQVRY